VVRILTLFIVVAVAELGTFLAVESRIGLLPTLGIALFTAVLGSFLVRRAGASVLRDLRREIGAGVLPGRQLTHGASILVAGALLISPGFLTDTIGFTLLIPAVRDLIHRSIVNHYQDRVSITTMGGSGEIIDVESWE
jgi:UPF0716 protein FxsA